MSGTVINHLLDSIIESDAVFGAGYSREDADDDAALSDPADMGLVDKVVDGIESGQLEAHLQYLNNFRHPEFCELYMLLKADASGTGIPDALIYLAALRVYVFQKWRGTTIMWPFEFANWLELHLARDRNGEDDAHAGQGQLLREYVSPKWTRFVREWKSRVRPLFLPMLTRRATRVAQQREMLRRVELKGLGPCPLDDFRGIEYLQIVDTIPLAYESIIPTLARRMHALEAHHRSASAVQPGELATHMARMITDLRRLASTLSAQVRTTKLEPAPMPARHGDMQDASGVDGMWEKLGTAVLENEFLTFGEGNGDATTEVRQWDARARDVATELLEIQSIVNHVFATKYDHHSETSPGGGEQQSDDSGDIPLVPELAALTARIDDATNSARGGEIESILYDFSASDLRELQRRLQQQFATTNAQIQTFNRHQSSGAPVESKRRRASFVRLWRRPGKWQTAVEQVYEIASSRIHSSRFAAFGRQMCVVLVQAHLQEPRMEVKVPLMTYLRKYDKFTWSTLARHAPVRETLGSTVGAIIVVWPGIIDHRDGASQAEPQLQAIDARLNAPLPIFTNKEVVVTWKWK